jgi:hypothetical protein
MLIKHVVILGMIIVSAYLQRGPLLQLEHSLSTTSESQLGMLIARVKNVEYALLVMGVIVLLLTVIAEAA